MKQYEIVKDINGNEVKADEINVNGLFTNFEKDLFGTLRNKEYTFWADVECVSKRNNKYTFKSTTYGHKFIVDFNNNTVMYER